MQESQTSFSGQRDQETMGEYRRMSVLAAASLVFGILSIGSTVYPGVWIVPIIGVVFGVFGLRSIRKNDDVSGALPAWTGILLALFFLSCAMAQYYFDRWVIYAESKEVAQRWLQLVADGESMIAHQAMLHPAQRQPTGFSVDDYYSMDTTARKDMEALFSKPPTSEIVALGKDAKITFVGNVTQDVSIGKAKLIRQVFRVTGAEGEPVEAMLSLTREYRPDLGRATWIVADIGVPEW